LFVGYAWKDFSRFNDLDNTNPVIDNFYETIEHRELKQLLNLRELKRDIDIKSNPIFNNLLNASTMTIFLNKKNLTEYKEFHRNNFYNEKLELIPIGQLNIGNIEKIEFNVNTSADYILLKKEFLTLLTSYEQQTNTIDSLVIRLERLENSKNCNFFEKIESLRKTMLKREDECEVMHQQSDQEYEPDEKAKEN